MNQVEKINVIIDKLTALSEKDLKDLYEFLDHDEWGIALEVLCAALHEEKMQISGDVYNDIKSIGEEMDMDPYLWEQLKPLIRIALY